MESPHWSPEKFAAPADAIDQGASDQAIRPAAMATTTQARLIRHPDPIGLTIFSPFQHCATCGDVVAQSRVYGITPISADPCSVACDSKSSSADGAASDEPGDTSRSSGIVSYVRGLAETPLRTRAGHSRRAG